MIHSAKRGDVVVCYLETVEHAWLPYPWIHGRVIAVASYPETALLVDDIGRYSGNWLVHIRDCFHSEAGETAALLYVLGLPREVWDPDWPAWTLWR